MTAHATPDEVKKLAALARLTVSEEELPVFVAEFEAILGYMGQLETLDIAAGTDILPYANTFRTEGAPHEKGAWTRDIVKAFPNKEGDSLSVKKILSND
ncbi:MAG: aspartyl/glutamyl-tRNA(Asn/Gln) amidotransferase, C subunit [Parcubacteria bacterium C7867-007]|nr:MAG: aspartyl/glutamyl-tRNA(Asn/Gln) amidotransferase, C subunit [Parcubacteria bacterium C7867-007]